MWGKRAPRLLHRIFLQQALPADAASAHAAGSSLQLLPSLTASGPLRAYNTSFWDMPGHSARVSDLCLELDSIRSMLPNKSTFTPQFTPHGIMLMPKSCMQPMDLVLPQQQQQTDVDGAEAAAAAEAEPEAGLWADSVKRKRRLKMKRHKLKKRRKLARHQQ